MKLMDGLVIMGLRDDMATMDEAVEGSLSGEAPRAVFDCGSVRLRLTVCE